jgi:hypothetical protein
MCFNFLAKLALPWQKEFCAKCTKGFFMVFRFAIFWGEKKTQKSPYLDNEFPAGEGSQNKDGSFN